MPAPAFLHDALITSQFFSQQGRSPSGYTGGSKNLAFVGSIANFQTRGVTVEYSIRSAQTRSTHCLAWTASAARI